MCSGNAIMGLREYPFLLLQTNPEDLPVWVFLWLFLAILRMPVTVDQCATSEVGVKGFSLPSKVPDPPPYSPS